MVEKKASDIKVIIKKYLKTHVENVFQTNFCFKNTKSCFWKQSKQSLTLWFERKCDWKARWYVCRHIVYRRVFHGEISIDTIFHGEISIRIISGEIPKNRRYLVIYQRFFPIYQMVNAGQQRSNALQCLKNALFLYWGDSNPLVWGSTKLPLG